MKKVKNRFLYIVQKDVKKRPRSTTESSPQEGIEKVVEVDEKVAKQLIQAVEESSLEPKQLFNDLDENRDDDDITQLYSEKVSRSKRKPTPLKRLDECNLSNVETERYDVELSGNENNDKFKEADTSKRDLYNDSSKPIEKRRISRKIIDDESGLEMPSDEINVNIELQKKKTSETIHEKDNNVDSNFVNRTEDEDLSVNENIQEENHITERKTRTESLPSTDIVMRENVNVVNNCTNTIIDPTETTMDLKKNTNGIINNNNIDNDITAHGTTNSNRITQHSRYDTDVNILKDSRNNAVDIDLVSDTDSLRATLPSNSSSPENQLPLTFPNTPSEMELDYPESTSTPFSKTRTYEATPISAHIHQRDVSFSKSQVPDEQPSLACKNSALSNQTVMKAGPQRKNYQY